MLKFKKTTIEMNTNVIKLKKQTVAKKLYIAKEIEVGKKARNKRKKKKQTKKLISKH